MQDAKGGNGDFNAENTLKGQVQKSFDAIDERYLTQKVVAARVFHEKDKMEKYQKLQKESQDILKKNDILIFPSIKLKCLDKMPKIDILMTDMQQLPYTAPKNTKSTVLMIRKILVDFIRDIAQ